MSKRYTCNSCGWQGARLEIKDGTQVCGQCGASIESGGITVTKLFGVHNIPAGTTAQLKKEWSPTTVADIKGKIVGSPRSGVYFFEFEASPGYVIEVTLDQIVLEQDPGNQLFQAMASADLGDSWSKVDSKQAAEVPAEVPSEEQQPEKQAEQPEEETTRQRRGR